MRKHKATDLEIRDLAMLSNSQIETLGSLEISQWQEIKGASFAESIEAWQSEESQKILGFCYLLEGQLVGMVLFKRPPISPAWVPAEAATVHGLKISTPWQRQGLGHRAFELAISKLKEQWPDIKKLMLSVDADNTAAIAVYRAYGMTEYEPVRKGNNGPEYRFEVLLSF